MMVGRKQTVSFLGTEVMLMELFLNGENKTINWRCRDSGPNKLLILKVEVYRSEKNKNYQ